MQEKLHKKIEEIRQKPEHIRVMYMWTAVGIVMFLVFVIWIVTLRENLRKTDPEIKELPQILRKPTEEQSIESMLGESSPFGSEIGGTEVEEIR